MADIQHNIDTHTIEAETVHSAPRKGNKFAWIALALTIGAWCALMWSNGYVALAVGALAVTSGFIGLRGSSINIKRLSITAIIASTVLIVILVAFLIVIKIGMAV
ncbi:MAG: hypothetical protein JFR39_03550 [Muribaculaceae bacterium]|nr:hypothetical protein [Muribaculaceae bacterium]